LSSAGRGASQSLDGHKKARDVALAILEVKKAELLVAHMDERVWLSKRSRNSSQASSVRSDEQSMLSSPRRSHRRGTSVRKTPQTTVVSHIDGGDRSGPVPGHASPQYAHDTVHTDTNDLMASGGPSQAIGAHHYDGGDRSGPVPGHAPHWFAQGTNTTTGVQTTIWHAIVVLH
jgi:hypothetical protein